MREREREGGREGGREREREEEGEREEEEEGESIEALGQLGQDEPASGLRWSHYSVRERESRD